MLGNNSLGASARLCVRLLLSEQKNRYFHTKIDVQALDVLISFSIRTFLPKLKKTSLKNAFLRPKNACVRVKKKCVSQNAFLRPKNAFLRVANLKKRNLFRIHLNHDSEPNLT